jgi:hypothetical protein
MVNERFPHTVKITRVTENPDYNPSFGDGEESIVEEIFNSVCQNQIGANGNTSEPEGAFLSDYIIYAPYAGDRKDCPEVKRSDKVEMNDGVRLIKGTVSQFEAGNLGIRIWWNEN